MSRYIHTRCNQGIANSNSTLVAALDYTRYEMGGGLLRAGRQYRRDPARVDHHKYAANKHDGANGQMTATRVAREGEGERGKERKADMVESGNGRERAYLLSYFVLVESRGIRRDAHSPAAADNVALDSHGWCQR